MLDSTCLEAKPVGTYLQQVSFAQHRGHPGQNLVEGERVVEFEGEMEVEGMWVVNQAERGAELQERRVVN
jgi:hypothetical protein